MSSDSKVGSIGSIGWIDMSTADASGVRDFYKAVVGWDTEDVDMGGYADYVMKAPDSGDGVAGVCHARGSNAELPPGWLIYITVADVEASAAACTKHGGKVLVEPRGLAGGRFCVVEDPGGSVAALYQP
jgi:predicted enzyme related to lactoylglutathione lyase